MNALIELPIFLMIMMFDVIFSLDIVSSWRRPSIRSIAIEEEDDEYDDEAGDSEMGPDKKTIQNTLTNAHNNLPIPPFTITK